MISGTFLTFGILEGLGWVSVEGLSRQGNSLVYYRSLNN